MVNESIGVVVVVKSGARHVYRSNVRGDYYGRYEKEEKLIGFFMKVGADLRINGPRPRSLHSVLDNERGAFFHLAEAFPEVRS